MESMQKQTVLTVTRVYNKEECLKVYINDFYVAYMYPTFILIESAYVSDIDKISKEIKEEIIYFLNNEKKYFLKKYTILKINEPDPILPINKIRKKLPYERDSIEAIEIEKKLRSEEEEKLRLERKQIQYEKKKEKQKIRHLNRTPEQIEIQREYQRKYRERRKASKK